MILTILPALMLASCGKTETLKEQEGLIDTVLGEVPFEDGTEAPREFEIPEFSVPDDVPRLRTDPAGYEPDADKKLLCVAEGITECSILNVTTMEKAGVVILREKETGLYQGEFTEIREAGDYIAYNEETGFSYPFRIGDDIYDGWVPAYLRALHGAEEVGAEDMAAITLSLLQAFEYDPSLFDDTSISVYSADGVPDVLEELYGRMSILSETEDGVFAVSAFARLGAVLRSFKPDEADYCLFRAEEAYARIDRSSCSDTGWYMMNATLFRTTGKSEYDDEVRLLFDAGDPGKKAAGTDGKEELFWGDYAYLTTKRLASQSICNTIMSRILAEARETVSAAKQGSWLVTTASSDGSSNDLLLQQAQQLTYINGVITNREYRMVIQECVHYLRGRNPSGKSYVGESGVYCKGGRNELYYGAILTAVLSRIDLEYEQIAAN